MAGRPSFAELASKFARQRASQFGGGGSRGSGGSGGPPPNLGAILGGTGGVVLLAAVGLTVNASLFNVDGGHRAIKYTRLHGVTETVYNEGTHFAIPWFESPVVYDVRSKPRSIASLTGTKGPSPLPFPPSSFFPLTLAPIRTDLQMVNITCRVLCRPRVDALPKIYTELGTNYDEVVLPSIVNEVLKSVVAQFNASYALSRPFSLRPELTPARSHSQLVTQREMVSKLVRDNLERRASRFNLILDDVSITHVTFSPAFSEAVEAKQIAQQTAQRAAYLVDQALQEKQSIIVKAQGEARSAELIGEAVKQNKGFLQLRKMEAAREIAGVVANSSNKLMLDSDALLLDLQEGN
ncbi:SPOSA6832_01721 [Sporobolomyces salmonicolor]|uniref:SPOSA6832_01721-mRNA-1:cds n=1 Tax=Sporidiobolus salmonicolor TaxID=5005 RepID=A0A0D6EKB5_SPOSA|nr:SPOSA6832_01721 [Sporobolomyces salmonicolor]